MSYFLLWRRFGTNKAYLFRLRTMFLFWVLVAAYNFRFSWSIFQKFQDPGVFDLKTLGSWSFRFQNSRILEFLFQLEILSLSKENIPSFYHGTVLEVTKHACSGCKLNFCLRCLLRSAIVIALEVFFKNSTILEFSISKFQDPEVFNLKTPGS